MRVFGRCIIHRWHFYAHGYRRVCTNPGCPKEQIYTHPDGLWEDAEKVRGQHHGPLTVKSPYS
jgi:hypothetical protein